MKSRRRFQDWQHLLAMCMVIAVLSGALIFVFLHVNIIPDPSSVERGYIDDFLKILLSIASIFFAAVIVVLVYSLIFFRRRPDDTADGPPVRGFAPLERAWTIIPLIIVVGLAVYGSMVLDKMTAPGPPRTEMEIDVLAFRYGWQFTYPEYNITSYELHVPVNQRILVKLQSKDVVHSFWVQEWGPKQDAVPGLTTQVRYTPTRTGQYFVECSQLCGEGHSYMIAPVFVTSAGDFQKWVQQQPKTSTAPTPTPTTTAPVPGQASGNTTINLTASNLAFDLSTITVPAGAQVTVNFNNQDNSVAHNFAVYTNSSATQAIFTGQIITGPSTVTYKFTAPPAPGNYFFRCDVHPSVMTGTFVVK